MQTRGHNEWPAIFWSPIGTDDLLPLRQTKGDIFSKNARITNVKSVMWSFAGEGEMSRYETRQTKSAYDTR